MYEKCKLNLNPGRHAGELWTRA